jgi:sodium/bile acid cotransporter 7
MWAKLRKHWFLASLAICFTVGFVFASQLQPLLEMSALRNAIVFAVMWAMGVTLRSETIRRSLAKPWPSMLAIGINVLLVPLLGLPWMFLLPKSLFGGLFVTSIVPCTLASASVWTRKAGGDDSIAMMTTVVTNLACVLVVPLGIWLVLTQQAEIDAVAQVKKLALLVVFPLILAQVMRRLGADLWADRNKIRLGLASQFGILSMVMFGAVASATTASGGESGVGVAWIAGAAVLLAAVVVHSLAMYLGVVWARAARMQRESQIAVGMAGSQKTLMVGLQIAIDCGVSVVPMIIYHLSQLVIDTVVADYWKRGNPPDGETLADGDDGRGRGEGSH